jgi:FtsZ-binding cell division protein ZapB
MAFIQKVRNNVDTLALLVILIGVVVITWITVSYMEIEKLKTTVNGYKTENEVIQTVGEDNTPSAAMAESLI